MGEYIPLYFGYITYVKISIDYKANSCQILNLDKPLTSLTRKRKIFIQAKLLMRQDLNIEFIPYPESLLEACDREKGDVLI